MKLEQQRRTSNISWMTRWHYGGNRALKGVVMGFIAQDREGKLH